MMQNRIQTATAHQFQQIEPSLKTEFLIVLRVRRKMDIGKVEFPDGWGFPEIRNIRELNLG